MCATHAPVVIQLLLAVLFRVPKANTDGGMCSKHCNTLVQLSELQEGVPRPYCVCTVESSKLQSSIGALLTHMQGLAAPYIYIKAGMRMAGIHCGRSEMSLKE